MPVTRASKPDLMEAALGRSYARKCHLPIIPAISSPRPPFSFHFSFSCLLLFRSAGTGFFSSSFRWKSHFRIFAFRLFNVTMWLKGIDWIHVIRGGGRIFHARLKIIPFLDFVHREREREKERRGISLDQKLPFSFHSGIKGILGRRRGSV